GVRWLTAHSQRAQRREGQLSRISQRLYRARLVRDLQEDRSVPGGNDLVQGTAADSPSREPGWIAHRALRTRLLPRKAEWRRRYVQGYQTLCRLRRLGLLHFQSPRAEGSDGQREAQVRVRLLPHRERQEGRRLDPVLSAARQIKSSSYAPGSPTQGTVL